MIESLSFKYYTFSFKLLTICIEIIFHMKIKLKINFHIIFSYSKLIIAEKCKKD